MAFCSAIALVYEGVVVAIPAVIFNAVFSLANKANALVADSTATLSPIAVAVFNALPAMAILPANSGAAISPPVTIATMCGSDCAIISGID